MRRVLLLLSFLLAALINRLHGQPVHMVKATGNISVDGQLNEEDWKRALVITGFGRNFPDDTATAAYASEVRLLYDDNALYISAVLHRNAGMNYSVSQLKKDFIFYENDAFGVILDPFSDKTNGYGFYVNAYGARRDEQIAGGTVADAGMDINWMAEVWRSTDRWQLEIAIPFKYIRHKENATWNINFVRNDRGANERSSWVRVPINFLLNNLAFSGQLQWDSTVSQNKKRVSLIPGITVNAVKENGKRADMGWQPSLDAKIALSSSVNMDVTINPDFSQAEADIAQLNLGRFELVFPENRLFFIENSDLFGGFGDDTWGNPVMRPFYSRRIGLRYDSTIGGYVPSKISGGVRLSGKLNNNLRFGGMTVFTQQERLENDGRVYYNPSQNYSVLALQQKLFTRSSFSAMLVNRQSFGTDSTNTFAFNAIDYSRVLAAEYNFASPDDKFSGKLFYHTELEKNLSTHEFARGILFRHNTVRWRNWVQVSQVSKHYQPDVGLVPRNNIFDINLQGSYSIYPKKGKVNQWEFCVNPQFYLNADGRYSDHFFIWGIHPVWRNTAELWAVHIQERISLKAPFDPTFKDIVRLDSGNTSTYNYLRFYYLSDRRKSFWIEAQLDIGEYFTGRQVHTNGGFNYRVQPHAVLGIRYDIGYFSLPRPFTNNRVYYIGPKAEFSFTRNIFLTSLVQYSSLSRNLNFYGRFQWRFMPLSDLYVIYSANRDTQVGQFRNQQWVVKGIVWL